MSDRLFDLDDLAPKVCKFCAATSVADCPWEKERETTGLVESGLRPADCLGSWDPATAEIGF